MLNRLSLESSVGQVDPVWQAVLTQICSDLDSRQWQGGFGSIVSGYALVCLAELVRQRWQEGTALSYPKGSLRQVRAIAGLLDRLLTICADPAMSGRYPHPAFQFALIFMEFESWLPAVRTECDTLSLLRSEFQSQNARLAAFENPFSRPATRDFFDRVIALAERENLFTSRLYRPFVRDRKSFSSLLLADKTIAVFQAESGGTKTSQKRPPKKNRNARTLSLKGFQPK